MVLLSVVGLTTPLQVLTPAPAAPAPRSRAGSPAQVRGAGLHLPGVLSAPVPAPGLGLPGPCRRCPGTCHRPRAPLRPWHLPPVVPRCPGQQDTASAAGVGPGHAPTRGPGAPRRPPGTAAPVPAEEHRAGARAPSPPPQHLPRAAAAPPPSCATRNPPGEGGAAAAGTGAGGVGGPSAARASAAAVPGEWRAGHRRGTPGAAVTATPGARAGRARAATAE